jgi:hypothetical protein
MNIKKWLWNYIDRQIQKAMEEGLRNARLAARGWL